MAIEIAGFAQALARCQAFESVDAGELEDVLSSGQQPLEMLFVEPSADVALIRSGEPFKHLYFVQHGMIVPWQYPYSELSSPFLIGDHEFMMGAERWVGILFGRSADNRSSHPRRHHEAHRKKDPSDTCQDVSCVAETSGALLLDLPRYQRESGAEGCSCSDIPSSP